MFGIQDNQKGALSVYYAMMLAVMIPLIFTMMEGARVNAMKMRMECAVDLAMDSVLAEYNRELLKQYDLLFIDTSYDTGRGSLDNTISHMEDYLSYNLKTDKSVVFIGEHSDLLGLESAGIEFTRVSRATDETISSMVQDVTHHHETEIRIINGAVVKLGQEHGIPTPCNEMILYLVLAKQSLYLGR